MAKWLKEICLNEVSAVDEPANPLAKVCFSKAKEVPMKEGYPASDYAYVPDPQKPSTWKLRLTSEAGGKPDAGIVGAAIAALGVGFRGNKVQIPEADLSAVKDKVRTAWRSIHGKDAELPRAIAKCSDGFIFAKGDEFDEKTEIVIVGIDKAKDRKGCAKELGDDLADIEDSDMEDECLPEIMSRATKMLNDTGKNSFVAKLFALNKQKGTKMSDEKKDDVLAKAKEQEAEIVKIKAERDEAVAKAKEAEVAVAKAKEAETEITKLKADFAKMQEEAEKAEFTKRAVAMGEDAEFGEVLRKMAKAGDVKAVDAIEAKLVGYRKALSASELCKTFGGRNVQTGSAEEKLEKAASEIRKNNPKLSEAEANVMAYEANPELAAEARGV